MLACFQKHVSSIKQEIRQPPSPHSEPVPAGQTKFVCDTMLQGLGKKLRSCGIDCVILDNHQDHTMCVKIAQNEHRYILTKGCEIFKLVSINTNTNIQSLFITSSSLFKLGQIVRIA